MARNSSQRNVSRVISLVVIALAIGFFVYRKKSVCRLDNKQGAAVGRKSEYPILDVILNRTSQRVMSGDSVSDKELMTVFEAARWAPSSWNNQSWRFVYAKKNTPHWQLFFSLLADSNKEWVKNADVLIVVVSKKTLDYNGKPARTHSFDAGAAWQDMALQGTSMGLVVHAMEGFDYDRARRELAIPLDYDIECMIAIGRPAKNTIEKITDRKPLNELVFEGRLPS